MKREAWKSGPNPSSVDVDRLNIDLGIFEFLVMAMRNTPLGRCRRLRRPPIPHSPLTQERLFKKCKTDMSDFHISPKLNFACRISADFKDRHWIGLDWIHKEPCLTAPRPRTCGPAHGPGPMGPGPKLSVSGPGPRPGPRELSFGPGPMGPGP